jgi:hypothetical protein
MWAVTRMRATAETVEPNHGCASHSSDTSDTEDSDPLVAWPLLGMVAGAIAGAGAVLVRDRLQRLPRGSS